MKLFRALTVCLILPFSSVACDQQSADTTVRAKVDTHEIISAEYLGYMENALVGMGSIKDGASAEAYIAKAEELKPKLVALLKRAKAIAAPTDEQKAEIQAAKKEVDERINAIQKKLLKELEGNPPTPEEKAAKQEAMQEVLKKLMSGEFGEEMDSVTEAVDAIYGLED